MKSLLINALWPASPNWQYHDQTVCSQNPTSYLRKYFFSKIPSRSAISRWPFLDERARMFGILILRPATVVLRPLASCWPLHCTKMINSCFCKFDISTIFFSCKMTISFSDARGGGVPLLTKVVAYKWMKILVISNLGWKGVAYLDGKPAPCRSSQVRTKLTNQSSRKHLRWKVTHGTPVSGTDGRESSNRSQ